jgi:hypothetical protein
VAAQIAVRIVDDGLSVDAAPLGGDIPRSTRPPDADPRRSDRVSGLVHLTKGRLGDHVNTAHAPSEGRRTYASQEAP